MRSAPLPLALCFAACAVCILGCGYRLVRPDDRPALRLGAIDDLTPQGDLGLAAADHLRRRLGSADGARIELRGVVRPGDDTPAVFTGAGEQARAVGVEVELSAFGADGRLVGASGPVRRSRPLFVGGDATAVASARRRVMQQALDEALDAALDRLWAQLPDAVATADPGESS